MSVSYQSKGMRRPSWLGALLSALSLSPRQTPAARGGVKNDLNAAKQKVHPSIGVAQPISGGLIAS